MTSPTSRNSTCEKTRKKADCPKISLSKTQEPAPVFCYQETCEESKVLLDFFQKIAGMEGAEPRRPDKIRTPEKPLAGHTAWPAFPASGKPRFFTGCTPIFVTVYRLLSRKATTSENCGFVLCTKCGPRRTARKQFSKGLRSKTGVQQHPKNTQKSFFDSL